MTPTDSGLLLLCLAVGYLYGSVNYALIVTKLRTGKDIRTLGNRNAGAANVGRNLGLRWGTLVFLLDLSKSLLPMAMTELAFRSSTGPLHDAVLFAVGASAVVGHCRPLYYRFRGGRGIATAVGVYGWFVPAELSAAMIIGAILVLLFVRNVEHRLGPYTPIAFVTLTPLLTLAGSLLFKLRIAGRIPLGGYPWYVVAGTFLLSLLILWLDRSFMVARSRELRGTRGDGANES